MCALCPFGFGFHIFRKYEKRETDTEEISWTYSFIFNRQNQVLVIVSVLTLPPSKHHSEKKNPYCGHDEKEQMYLTHEFNTQ